MNESNVLTPQEQKVSELAAQGLSNKKIGESLSITEKTVKFHLTKVYKKLGVTRYQLIAGNQGVTVQPGQVATLQNGDITVPAQQ